MIASMPHVESLEGKNKHENCAYFNLLRTSTLVQMCFHLDLPAGGGLEAILLPLK